MQVVNRINKQNPEKSNTKATPTDKTVESRTEDFFNTTNNASTVTIPFSFE